MCRFRLLLAASGLSLVASHSAGAREELAKTNVRLNGELPLQCGAELVQSSEEPSVALIRQSCNAPHALRVLVVNIDASAPWRGAVSYRGRRLNTNEFGNVEFYFPTTEDGVWPLEFMETNSASAAVNGGELPDRAFISLEIAPE